MGAFIGALIEFIVIAWVLFLVVRAYTRTRPAPEEAPEPGPSEEVVLLTEIRDSLCQG